MPSKYEVGARVWWQNGPEQLSGVVREIYGYTVTKQVHEGTITQHGSEGDPVLLIDRGGGEQELKLQSEVGPQEWT